MLGSKLDAVHTLQQPQGLQGPVKALVCSKMVHTQLRTPQICSSSIYTSLWSLQGGCIPHIYRFILCLSQRLDKILTFTKPTHIPSVYEIYVMWFLAGIRNLQHYRFYPHTSWVMGKHYFRSEYVFDNRTCGHLNCTFAVGQTFTKKALGVTV